MYFKLKQGWHWKGSCGIKNQQISETENCGTKNQQISETMPEGIVLEAMRTENSFHGKGIVQENCGTKNQQISETMPEGIVLGAMRTENSFHGKGNV